MNLKADNRRLTIYATKPIEPNYIAEDAEYTDNHRCLIDKTNQKAATHLQRTSSRLHCEPLPFKIKCLAAEHEGVD